MVKQVTVKEGATYDYLPYGFVVFVVLVLFGGLKEIYILAFFGLFLGIGIMAMRFGVQIDAENSRIRRYSAFYGLKFGRWSSLTNVARVKLTYERKSSRRSGAWFEMVTPTISNSGRSSIVKTYPLYFEDSNGFETEFHQFVKMKPAFELMDVFEKILRIETDNQLISMQQLLGKGSKR